jgi:hypothetical protein
MWQGYVERRDVRDGDRKRAGAEARKATPSVAVLQSPDEVADWMRAQLLEVGKEADDWAQKQNELLLHPANVHRSTARKGSSVYASIRVSREQVVDVCAEIVSEDDSCPAGVGGHTYSEVKGEWRCTRCGKKM